MKRISSLVIALLALALPALAGTSPWAIDPDHSNAQFKVRHMMIADVRGNFSDVQGSVQIDEQDLTQSTVDVTITAASISTGVSKRDEHLKSADFFDVATYPTLNFKSTAVQMANDNTLKVLGDLTIHGVTRKVELLVSGLSGNTKDPWGNTRKGALITTTINRKDFGIVYNATLDNGGLLIGEEVEIAIDLEIIQQAG